MTRVALPAVPLATLSALGAKVACPWQQRGAGPRAPVAGAEDSSLRLHAAVVAQHVRLSQARAAAGVGLEAGSRLQQGGERGRGGGHEPRSAPEVRRELLAAMIAQMAGGAGIAAGGYVDAYA